MEEEHFKTKLEIEENYFDHTVSDPVPLNTNAVDWYNQEYCTSYTPNYQFETMYPSIDYFPPSYTYPDMSNNYLNQLDPLLPDAYQYINKKNHKNLNSQESIKQCSNCHCKETPSWRRCPKGIKLLCNACGLYEKLHKRPRPVWIDKDGFLRVYRTRRIKSGVKRN